MPDSRSPYIELIWLIDLFGSFNTNESLNSLCWSVSDGRGSSEKYIVSMMSIVKGLYIHKKKSFSFWNIYSSFSMKLLFVLKCLPTVISAINSATHFYFSVVIRSGKKLDIGEKYHFEVIKRNFTFLIVDMFLHLHLVVRWAILLLLVCKCS